MKEPKNLKENSAFMDQDSFIEFSEWLRDINVSKERIGDDKVSAVGDFDINKRKDIEQVDEPKQYETRKNLHIQPPKKMFPNEEKDKHCGVLNTIVFNIPTPNEETDSIKEDKNTLLIPLFDKIYRNQ